eukprot:gene342-1716_t
MMYAGLVFAQVCTFCAYVVVTAGAGENDTAKAVYEEYRIEVVQAGLIMVGIANGFTIIFLGLYDDTAATSGDTHDETARRFKGVQAA